MQTATNLSQKHNCSQKHTLTIRDRRILRLKRTRLMDIPQNNGDCEIDLVRMPEGLREACRLVHDQYVKIGLIDEQPGGLWVTPYQINPDSRAVIALVRVNGEPISTATLVQDCDIGLPSERLYPEEIGRLKNRGRRVVEITSLAAKSCRQGPNAFLNIFKWIGVYSVLSGYEDMVISVNPKHASFYEDILLFKPIGPLKYYPGLKNAPAVLEWTDLTTMHKRMKEAYDDMPDFANLYRFFAGKNQSFLKYMKNRIESEDVITPKHSWESVINVLDHKYGRESIQGS